MTLLEVMLRKASESKPSWWASACGGDFSELDAWLMRIVLHLDQLRDLPPESDLAADPEIWQVPAADQGRRRRHIRNPTDPFGAP